jgi:molecular chaperone HtpG
MPEETTEKNHVYKFHAEIQQIMNILVHSLYQENEIFLRELISNASDALHRLQFEMLTNHQVFEAEAPQEITIEVDEPARLLRVSDSGIGMTREEIRQNLGTIAHSGALAALQKAQEQKQSLSELIGKFGVGFYSIFMVAEEVTVTSRSFLEEAEPVCWISRGGDSYHIRPAEKGHRGTTVELKLKEEALEFLRVERLRRIIKTHSDFIAFPIKLAGEVVNQQTAIWRLSPKSVTKEQYGDFYRQLTLEAEPPLWRTHVVADAPVQLFALVYFPAVKERLLPPLSADFGLKLYSNKILIADNFKEFLPNYLRFLKGVVDSEDLPLNVSRDTIQKSRTIDKIGQVLTGRILSSLDDMAENHAPDYHKLWQSYGVFIKEGLASDGQNKEKLLKLLRFTSSKSQGQEDWRSLKDYMEAMPAEQKEIYFLLGADRPAIERSPHLDYFKKHDIEVIYFYEPIDSFMIFSLREYEGKSIRSVDEEGLQLPAEIESAEAPPPADEPAWGSFKERIKKALGDKILDVRESKLLLDSPCRLVTPGDLPAASLDRVQRLLDKDYKAPPRIFEINRNHPLIKKLAGTKDEALGDLIVTQLYELSLLQEGLHPDPAALAPGMQQLMEFALKSESDSVS